MTWGCHRKSKIGGSAPATPGFNAVAPEWLHFGAADAAPAVPAAESTLGSHPCVALSSAQVLPEWINRNLAVSDFPSDGDYPLNFLSHSGGSLQSGVVRRGDAETPRQRGEHMGEVFSALPLRLRVEKLPTPGTGSAE